MDEESNSETPPSEEWIEEQLENIGVNLTGETQLERLRSLAPWAHDRTGNEYLTENAREIIEVAAFQLEILRNNTPRAYIEETHSGLDMMHYELRESLRTRSRRIRRLLRGRMYRALDMTDSLVRLLNQYTEDLESLSEVESEMHLRMYGAGQDQLTTAKPPDCCLLLRYSKEQAQKTGKTLWRE
jgi:hypothetical protein